MANPVKFTFDRAFDGGASSRAEQKVAEAREEARVAAEHAYQEGHAAGQTAALEGIEQSTQQVLAIVADGLKALFDQCHVRDQEQAREAGQIAAMIGYKLANKLMDQAPLSVIEPLIEECLDLVRDEPRVVVRVPEALVEPLGERVDYLTQAHDFKGKVILIPEPTMGVTDVQVEWPNGGLKRDLKTIEQDIDRLVTGFLRGPQTQPDT